MAAHLDDHTKSLIQASYPSAVTTEADGAALSSQAFPSTEYSTAEKAEVEQWLSHASKVSDDAGLATLNTHLSTRTTVLGAKPSIADVALYGRLAPVVKGWNDDRRTGANGYHHIVRYIDFVQNAPLFGLKVPESEKVSVNPDNVVSKIPPVDPKAEKERKKKEKEAAAAGAGAGAGTVAGTAAAADGNQKSMKTKVQDTVANIEEKVKTAVGAEGAPKEGKKKEKKEKQPKQPKAPAVPEKPLSPALIDLRVGHILKAERHPNADSLYVSTIAVGDPAGTDNTSEYEGQVCRTVCSGLNGLVPLEEMQGRKIVAVCNLKPVTMRGIKSAAMVLAASPRLKEGEVDNHAGPVELVDLPAEAKAGERVYFDGWQGEPEGVLNPKKKIWETLQPGFTTTGEKEVAFDVGAVEALKESGKSGLGKLRTASGFCTVKTLTNATVR
ncbi:nucleic acid-binding protein [Myriangium duriaei CBS 260.36]|uniref:Nucleic acid-binding protein n=1 Tax=Myriangium duriaei CBS 260.36 TaxID=1168546 RepID=A0A9P4MJR7_9PEZI|nr:nucleic acid-binding protein [Myriangium duriaei CBS 260.36]